MLSVKTESRSVNAGRFLVYSTMMDGPFRMKDLDKVVSGLRLRKDDVIWLSEAAQWVALSQVKLLLTPIPGGKERRTHARAPLSATATIHNNAGMVFFGSIRNISSGGILISNLEKFQIGEKVTVVIRSAYFESPIQCHGKIVRVSQDKPEAQGVAIEFLDLDASDKEMIDAYVEHITHLAQELIQAKLKTPEKL